jgi:hypothetical protein
MAKRSTRKRIHQKTKTSVPSKSNEPSMTKKAHTSRSAKTKTRGKIHSKRKSSDIFASNISEKGSSTDESKREDRQQVSRGRTGTKGQPSTGLSLINRNIFRDPFFTEPWEDLFNIPSFDNILSTARDLTKNALKSAENIKKGRIDTSHPGAYSTKSFYRTFTSEPGQEPRREVVSQETVTNVDKEGKKYTEKWKNYEKGSEVKTTHTKMIDDKGVKEMRTHNANTGEEYEHVDYKKINEKDLNNFNSEFNRGLRNVSGIMPSTGFNVPSFRNMLSDIGGRDFGFGGLGGLGGHFGHMHSPLDRFGLPMGEFGSDFDQSTRRMSAATDTSEKKGKSTGQIGCSSGVGTTTSGTRR